MLTLTVETDVLVDSLGIMETISERLARKHGDRYRALDRRIFDLMQQDHFPSVVSHEIGEGHIIMGPPPEITAIIRQARELGVI